MSNVSSLTQIPSKLPDVTEYSTSCHFSPSTRTMHPILRVVQMGVPYCIFAARQSLFCWQRPRLQRISRPIFKRNSWVCTKELQSF
uniref:Putative ovule protein n=1 Tax=Solanum chacoense TaxID=4108 RepID=A0A0V0H344_SOLCH